jgi:membrane-bound lytic murein transglycosylase D
LRIAAACIALAALLQGCADLSPAPPDAPPAPVPPASVAPEEAPPVLAAPAPAPPPMPIAPFKGEHLQVVDLPPLPTIDRTVAPQDLWQRIRQGFAMPDIDGPLVRRQTAYYAAHPEYLQRMLDRSRLYLFHIVDEIEKRGMPTELALLPMVESAFNPMAYSRAHASGLWQFIPGTGRRYELEQSWWYDERRDIVDSTAAALAYLTYLYEMHGDWQLALASYNCGENCVARAVAKNRRAHKPAFYSNLSLPRETRNYVPKLQALKNIIANPAPYDVDLDPIPNEPYFATIEDAPDMDVLRAAKLAEMPVEEFIALNPGFSRPLIRASGGARIVLPADKVDTFRENLAENGDEPLISWQIYHPRRGEKLGAIARKFHFSSAELKRVNGIPSRSWRVPRVLIVPLDPEAAAAAVRLPIAYAPPQARAGARGVYVVRRGDTLSGIAARFHVRVSDLKRWNRLGKVLRIGQKLHVRAPTRS